MARRLPLPQARGEGAAKRPADHIRRGRLTWARGCSFRPLLGAVSVTPRARVGAATSRSVGATRAWVAASNPEASLIRVGSLNAVPKKLMPTGMPSTMPEGTCTIG